MRAKLEIMLKVNNTSVIIAEKDFQETAYLYKIIKKDLCKKVHILYINY